MSKLDDLRLLLESKWDGLVVEDRLLDDELIESLYAVVRHILSFDSYYRQYSSLQEDCVQHVIGYFIEKNVLEKLDFTNSAMFNSMLRKSAKCYTNFLVKNIEQKKLTDKVIYFESSSVSSNCDDDSAESVQDTFKTGDSTYGTLGNYDVNPETSVFNTCFLDSLQSALSKAEFDLLHAVYVLGYSYSDLVDQYNANEALLRQRVRRIKNKAKASLSAFL